MPRAEPPMSHASIEALLRRGLDHYGRNEVTEAVALWREVLRIDPSNEQAVDFLQTAGFIPEKPEAQVLPFSRESTSARAPSPYPPAPSDASSASRFLSLAPDAPKQLITPDGDLADPELKTLLIERRFEDALQRLYALRSKRPRDEGLSRSIQLLREKLADVYSEQLVHLDRVPRLTSAAERHAFSSDERHIAALIDGISSFGDIVAASKLGRVPTLRILCQLQQAHLITSSSSSIAAPRHVGPVPGASKAHTPSAYHPPSTKSAYHPPTPSGRPTPAPSSSSPVLTPPSFDEPPPWSPPPRGPNAHAESEPGRSSAPISPPVSSPEARAAAAYEARFAQAMHFYLVRDFERAIELFRQCEAERPDDPRPRHNLKAIQNRMGKS